MARIILTDDEPATRDLVSRALLIDGHTVSVMTSGVEALDHLRRNAGDVDILVTDVNMPGMDGFELATHALALQPKLAVVMMSGFIEQLERANELHTTRIAIVAKPFTLEDIRTKVRDVMTR
jgi:CheY-like chemotaxis protein